MSLLDLQKITLSNNTQEYDSSCTSCGADSCHSSGYTEQ